MTAAAIFTLARRFWWIGPIIAAGILFALWRGAEAEADRYKAAVLVERQSHEVTLASVKKLSDALKAKNAESDARAKAFTDARVEAAGAQAKADEAYRSTQGRIDALRASVGKSGAVVIETPKEVRDALAGL